MNKDYSVDEHPVLDQDSKDLRSLGLLQKVFTEIQTVTEREHSLKSSAQSATNLKITNVTQFRSYSVRMIKALKEDLAKIQNEYVNLIN